MTRLCAALLAAIITALTVAPSLAGDPTRPASPAAGRPAAGRSPVREPDDRTLDVAASPRVSPNADGREKDRLLMLLLLLGVRHPLRGR